MYVCWKCKYEHQEDVTVCSQCGATNQTTVIIENTVHLKRSHPVIEELPDSKLLLITELALKIGDKKLVIPIDKRIIFGRNIPPTDDYIGVDLSGFNALEMGVSRRHADLRRVGTNRLILIDLGSTNGTRVNDNRLTPFKACALNHNDQIFFGKLNLTIHLVGISLPSPP